MWSRNQDALPEISHLRRPVPLTRRPGQPKGAYLRSPHHHGLVWGSWRRFSGDKHSQCKPGQPAAIPRRHGLAQNGQGAAGPSSYLNGVLCCRSCSGKYKLQERKSQSNLKSMQSREVREQCSFLSFTPWALVPTRFSAAKLMKHCGRGSRMAVPSCSQPKLHDQRLWEHSLLGEQPRPKAKAQNCTLPSVHWKENLNNFLYVCTFTFGTCCLTYSLFLLYV